MSARVRVVGAVALVAAGSRCGGGLGAGSRLQRRASERLGDRGRGRWTKRTLRGRRRDQRRRPLRALRLGGDEPRPGRDGRQQEPLPLRHADRRDRADQRRDRRHARGLERLRPRVRRRPLRRVPVVRVEPRLRRHERDVRHLRSRPALRHDRGRQSSRARASSRTTDRPAARRSATTVAWSRSPRLRRTSLRATRTLAYDVFLRDRLGGTTVRVSEAVGGGDANDVSHEPFVSADGRLVSYESSASNLVAGDTNGASDVFLFDVTTRRHDAGQRLERRRRGQRRERRSVAERGRTLRRVLLDRLEPRAGRHRVRRHLRPRQRDGNDGATSASRPVPGRPTATARRA